MNGITAEDWEEMKKNDLTAADRIIELFSDVVFEGILRKIQYLEYRAEDFVHAFQCLEDKLVLVAMESTDDEDEVNFLDSEYIQQATISPPENLVVHTSSKKYSKSRELELFDMISAGCTNSDG